ncbi:MAG: hypothetical protein R3E08_08130 [Thiotrichaceae bacterium]
MNTLIPLMAVSAKLKVRVGFSDEVRELCIVYLVREQRAHPYGCILKRLKPTPKHALDAQEYLHDLIEIGRRNCWY